jgi:hypothetical protein
MLSIAAFHIYKKMTKQQDTNQTSHMEEKYRESGGYSHMHALTRIDMQTPLCSALKEESFCQSAFLHALSTTRIQK